MYLIDQNEARNQPELCSLVAQSVEVQEGSFNQTQGSSLIYPDFTCMGGHVLMGINRKTTSEVLGSPEKVLEQLQRELAGPCEQIALIIEGIMVPDGQSGAWSYSIEFNNAHLYPNTDQRGTVPFRRQHSRTNWEHVQNTMTRLEWLGVQVLHSYSTYDTATKLIAFHKMAMSTEPNRVLDKLIKTELTVFALDPEERAFALSLMGLSGANIGQEIALTIAASFSNIMELVDLWNGGGTLADTMLRGGTRRIGTSAERKLQTALGWQAPSSPTPNPFRQDTETSPMLGSL